MVMVSTGLNRSDDCMGLSVTQDSAVIPDGILLPIGAGLGRHSEHNLQHCNTD